MVKKRSLCIALASVVAVTSMCLLMGVRDAKAQSMTDLLSRIEALESRSVGNVTAPKIKGLKIGFEVRHRFELLTDPSGSKANPDRDFTLQRTRVYLDADVNKNVRGYVKLQDVRTFGSEQSTTGNLQRVDLLEGYVELRNLGGLSSLLENVSVKLGRWQQWYGDHRLIGHLNWANQGRSYDGIKFRYDNKKGTWVDLFAYNIQEDQTGGVSGEVSPPNNFDPGTKDEVFWGVYSSFKATDGMAIEPYFIIRNRSRDADGNRTGEETDGEQRYTAGARIHGKNIPWLPGVDYTFEQAWQFGKTEPNSRFDITDSDHAYRSQDINAFAGAWSVGYTFKDAAWTPRIGYSFVYASGDDKNDIDSNSASGTNDTFSQLYPTGHARLGYMDFHGWQNIQAHKIAFSAKPSKKLLFKADLWFFEAAEDEDDWYSVGGSSTASAAPKTSGGSRFDDEYGREIDITLKYKLFQNFGVVAGYSHYWIDDAIENIRSSSNTNNNDEDTDWFYLMTTMKF